MNRKLGCLWNQTSTKGEYMSGELDIDGTITKIVVFKRDKRNEREPDWDILKSIPKEENN